MVGALRGSIPDPDEMKTLNEKIDKEPCCLIFVEDDPDLKE